MDEDTRRILANLDKKTRGLYVGMDILVRQVGGNEAIKAYQEELSKIMEDDYDE